MKVIVGLLDMFLNRRISANMPGGSWGVLLAWSSFFVVGYLQWFKLVPYLVRKQRASEAVVTGTTANWLVDNSD